LLNPPMSGDAARWTP